MEQQYCSTTILLSLWQTLRHRPVRNLLVYAPRHAGERAARVNVPYFFPF